MAETDAGPEKFLPDGREVLFVDDHLLAVFKPPGVVSHPNARGGGEKAAFLGSYDQKRRAFRKGGEELFLVHRLDGETSGVLLAARTPEAHQAMLRLFEEGRVEKRYRALLARSPRPGRSAWEDHLVVGKGGGAKSRALPGRPPNARLEVQLLASVGPDRYGHVRIFLETGKTHQIRAQAAARRMPVLGDRLYGNFTANREAKRSLGLKRLFLHAEALRFPHPVTGRTLEIKASLPPELEASLSLRKPAGRPSRSSRRRRKKR